MSIPIKSHNGDGVAVNGEMINRVQQLRLGDQLGKVKSSCGGNSLLPWILCGLMAIAWAGVGIRSYRTGAAVPASGAPSAPGSTPSPGQTNAPAPVAVGDIVIQLKANVIPSLQIAVSPDDVGARVMTVTFSEGKLVKQGDVLATVLNTRYLNDSQFAESSYSSALAKITELEATCESARAKLHEAKENLGLAERKLERFEASSSSQQDIDEAKTNKEVSVKRLYGAERDVVASEFRLMSARKDCTGAKARRDESARLLANCNIRAPIDGTVLTKKADVGSRVDSSAFNLSSTLCEIADLAKLEVEVDVPERQITSIKKGQECRIQADADPKREYRGTVDRIMPIADDSKNVIKVRIRVYLPKGRIAGRVFASENERRGDDLQPRLRQSRPRAAVG